MLKLETHVCVLALFGCFSAVACGGGGGGAPTTPSTTVTALAIAGSPTAAALGQSVSLILTATLSSGSIQIVTAQAAWQSSNSAVATVSSAGVVTTVGYGSAIITATYQGMTAQFTFTVTLAGAWISDTVSSGRGQIVWVLTQSGATVTGTFSFIPPPPDLVFSTATVGGQVSGRTFSWTATAIPSADSNASCIGVTTQIGGTAQIATSGTSLTITVTSAVAPCDRSGTTTGQTLTFTKQ